MERGAEFGARVRLFGPKFSASIGLRAREPGAAPRAGAGGPLSAGGRDGLRQVRPGPCGDGGLRRLARAAE